MQIRVKNINFSVIFEALNFCSWSLLIFNISIIGSQIETSLLLPGRHAYTSRPKSNEKTQEICVFCAYEVFSTRAWALLRFCLKKASKHDTLSPLWDPPMLTFEEVKMLIKHSIFKLFAIWVLSKMSSIGKSAEAFFDECSRACFVKP